MPWSNGSRASRVPSPSLGLNHPTLGNAAGNHTVSVDVSRTSTVVSAKHTGSASKSAVWPWFPLVGVVIGCLSVIDKEVDYVLQLSNMMIEIRNFNVYNQMFDKNAARTDLGTIITTDYDSLISDPQAIRYVAEFMLQTGLLG